MRRSVLVILTLFGMFILGIFVPALGVFAQSGDSAAVSIDAPASGAAIQGIVTIEGSTRADGFQSWELTFGYASDSTGTWFLITESDERIEQGELAQWDTTTLTDGTYNLRLTVFLEGGRREHVVINDIRVRNYAPIETITPTPTLTSTPFTETPRPSLTATITLTPTETPIPPTFTPRPTNPVEITQTGLNYSLIRGVAGAFAAFMVVGLYLSVKRIFKR